MGGAIALQLALDAPDRIAGLVLVATGARLRVGPQILDSLTTDFDAAVELLIGMQYGPTANPDFRRIGAEHLHAAGPDVVKGDFLACNAFDVIDRLAEIQVPALMIGGSADQMVPSRFFNYLAEHLLDAELHLVQDTGHMVAIEFPDQVAELICKWAQKKNWEP